MLLDLAFVEDLPQIAVSWNPIGFPLVLNQKNIRKYYFRRNIWYYIIRKYQLKARRDFKVITLPIVKVD